MKYLKNRKLSLTKVRNLLKKCQFDPRKPGYLKVVSELADANYYRKRAAEELLNDGNPVTAIRLLVMALHYEEA
jgi:hypothetical protein